MMKIDLREAKPGDRFERRDGGVMTYFRRSYGNTTYPNILKNIKGHHLTYNNCGSFIEGYDDPLDLIRKLPNDASPATVTITELPAFVAEWNGVTGKGATKAEALRDLASNMEAMAVTLTTEELKRRYDEAVLASKAVTREKEGARDAYHAALIRDAMAAAKARGIEPGAVVEALRPSKGTRVRAIFAGYEMSRWSGDAAPICLKIKKDRTASRVQLHYFNTDFDLITPAPEGWTPP